MNLNKEREHLLQRLEDSRRQLGSNLEDTGEALNLPRRLKDSIQRQPLWWIGGGVAAGLILSRIGTARNAESRPPAKQSFFLGLLQNAGQEIFRVAEPQLKEAVQQQIQQWTGVRYSDNGETAQPDQEFKDE